MGPTKSLTFSPGFSLRVAMVCIFQKRVDEEVNQQIDPSLLDDLASHTKLENHSLNMKLRLLFHQTFFSIKFAPRTHTYSTEKNCKPKLLVVNGASMWI